jgi:RNA polymerase sigma-70 factor (ECF subfamily)
MTMAPGPDRTGALLEQIAGGHPDSVAELYAETFGDVLRTVTAILVDRHHAEEVTQEVYLQLWLTAAARFDPTRGSGRSFVMAVARRRAIDRIRYVEASRRRETTWNTEGDSVDDFCDEAIIRVQIQHALHALGDRAHTIIAVYYHGQSYRETAQQLGVTVTTMKNRHHRTLAALRLLIQS